MKIPPGIWIEVRTLFEACMDVPEDQWKGLLDDQAGDRPDVREAVEWLLAAHRDLGAAPDEDSLDAQRTRMREVLEDWGPVEEHRPNYPRAKATGEPRTPLTGVAPDHRSIARLLDGLRRHSPGHGRHTPRLNIGEGGMGTILDVWDEDLERSLAMKVSTALDPGKGRPLNSKAAAILGRFLEEARVTGQLDHPGIPPVHELGVAPDGEVYFTMPLIRGRDFSEVIARVQVGEEGWSVIRAVGILQRVCEAVSFAHQRGVIHRDIKPANIRVGDYGEVYLMDWGIALLTTRLEPRSDPSIARDPEASAVETPHPDRRTGQDEIVGTPCFLPPELVLDPTAGAGRRTDVYALGATLYHLLAGVPPYLTEGERSTHATVLARLREGPPHSLEEAAPQTAPELVAICERAMARNPAERYPTADALADELRAFLEGRVVRAYEIGPWAEAKKWVQRNRPLARALAAALLVFVIGVFASSILYSRVSAAEAEVEANAREESLARFRDRAEGSLSEVLASRSDYQFARASVVDDLVSAYRELGLDPLASESESLRREHVEGLGLTRNEDRRLLLRGLAVLAVLRPDWDGPRDLVDALVDPWNFSELIQLSRTELESASPDVVDLTRDPDRRQLAAELIHAAGHRIPESLVSAIRRGARGYWDHMTLAAARSLSKDQRLIHAEVAASLRPENPWTHFCLGDRLLANDDLEQAHREYLKAEAVVHRPIVAGQLAQMVGRTGHVEESISKLDEAILRWPTDAELLRLRGLMESKRGNPIAAEEMLTRAVELDPDHALSWLARGVTRQTLRRLDDAIADYNRAIDERLDYHVAYKNLALALGSKRQFDEAIEAALHAIELEPTEAVYWNALGWVYGLSGRDDEALEAYLEALERDPTHPVILSNVGHLHLRNARFVDARETFERILASHPDHLWAHYNLARAQHTLGDLHASRAHFERCLELDPEHWQTMHELAHVLEDLGLRSESEQQIRAAMDQLAGRIPPGPSERADLACLCEMQGDFDGAIEHYEGAIVVGELTWPPPFLHLADLHRGQGDIQRALETYDRLIGVAPDDPMAHCNRAWALIQSGDFEAAIPFMERGHTLGIATEGWAYPSDRWLSFIEDLATRDDLARGERAPNTLEERVFAIRAAWRLRDHDRAIDLYSATAPELLDPGTLRVLEREHDVLAHEALTAPVFALLKRLDQLQESSTDAELIEPFATLAVDAAAELAYHLKRDLASEEPGEHHGREYERLLAGLNPSLAPLRLPPEDASWAKDARAVILELEFLRSFARSSESR